jgi:hypothetical protein
MPDSEPLSADIMVNVVFGIAASLLAICGIATTLRYNNDHRVWTGMFILAGVQLYGRIGLYSTEINMQPKQDLSRVAVHTRSDSFE